MVKIYFHIEYKVLNLIKIIIFYNFFLFLVLIYYVYFIFLEYNYILY